MISTGTQVYSNNKKDNKNDILNSSKTGNRNKITSQVSLVPSSAYMERKGPVTGAFFFFLSFKLALRFETHCTNSQQGKRLETLTIGKLDICEGIE
ncbi:hypothetical protein VTN00DRAFT_4605 [Thermoascus crustaceus]|uniref:uncharacterized protein n=1 Tax=Thermoascus crustaceus TaxID=5088 RepID=UPI0037436F90